MENNKKSIIPLAFFHVNAAIALEYDMFLKEQIPLPVKMRRQAPGMVYNTVAGVVSVIF